MEFLDRLMGIAKVEPKTQFLEITKKRAEEDNPYGSPEYQIALDNLRQQLEQKFQEFYEMFKVGGSHDVYYFLGHPLGLTGNFQYSDNQWESLIMCRRPTFNFNRLSTNHDYDRIWQCIASLYNYEDIIEVGERGSRSAWPYENGLLMTTLALKTERVYSNNFADRGWKTKSSSYSFSNRIVELLMEDLSADPNKRDDIFREIQFREPLDLNIVKSYSELVQGWRPIDLRNSNYTRR